MVIAGKSNVFNGVWNESIFNRVGLSLYRSQNVSTNTLDAIKPTIVTISHSVLKWWISTETISGDHICGNSNRVNLFPCSSIMYRNPWIVVRSTNSNHVTFRASRIMSRNFVEFLKIIENVVCYGKMRKKKRNALCMGGLDGGWSINNFMVSMFDWLECCKRIS